MCKFSSKSGGVPFQPLGDLTWNDPQIIPTILVVKIVHDVELTLPYQD